MNPKQIIPAFYNANLSVPDEPHLWISEFFYNTIQGEGVNVGVPSVFLRLGGCTLNCTYCDSKEVYQHANPYTIPEVLHMMDHHGLYSLFEKDVRFVITGGSPLKQQGALILLFHAMNMRKGWYPLIEIENECVIMPRPELKRYVHLWMNSPKLCSSGNVLVKRYNPKVLDFMGSETNSWFKFVITDYSDWDEIKRDFIEPGYINKEQMILMPCGATKKELETSKDIALEIALREAVRYSPRLHIEYWDKKTGV